MCRTYHAIFIYWTCYFPINKNGNLYILFTGLKSSSFMFYQMVLDKITRPVEDTDEDEEFDVELDLSYSLHVL